MATFTKFDDTVDQLGKAIHDWTAAGHVIKVALHSDAPVAATDDELADLSQVTGTGYTAGGIDITNDWTQSGATTTLTGADQTWTATAADWIAARYVVIHNDTSTTDKLIGDWDYGGNFTLGNGETFTVDFGASVASLT